MSNQNKASVFQNKKLLSNTLIILYDVVLFIWCVLIVGGFIERFSYMSANKHQIGIIGGAELTLLTFSPVFLPIILICIFWVLCITLLILLNVSAFKKPKSLTLHILVSIFSGVLLLVLGFTPGTAYLTTSLLQAGVMPLFLCFLSIYIILTLAIVARSIFLAVKLKRECKAEN